MTGEEWTKLCKEHGVVVIDANYKNMPHDDAVKYFECKPDTKRERILDDYFEYLKQNKLLFDSPDTVEQEAYSIKGRSNHRKVIEYLKASLREEKKYTETDVEYIQKLLQAYQNGVIPYAVSKKISDFINKEFDNLKILNKIRSEVSAVYLQSEQNLEKLTHTKKIVVLSEFMYAEN